MGISLGIPCDSFLKKKSYYDIPYFNITQFHDEITGRNGNELA